MTSIAKTLKSYDPKNLHIGTLGGHSALDIASGAKQQGFKTVAVCQKGRHKTYTKYYKNLFDQIILVDKFSQLTNKSTVNKLQNLNTIFIQSRYFWVYCKYQKIESSFPIPIFGTRGLVKREERDMPKNQYYLMDKAGIRYPKIFPDPASINRLSIVKVAEANRSYERAFFFAINEKDFHTKANQLLNQKNITRKALKQAVIEEFIVGAQVNFNFFYSPITKSIELMGTDTRRQTNIDGLLRLPATEQVKVLKYLKPQYIETGHQAVTVKESLLEKAFTLAEKLVKTVKKIHPPGIIGPFALQSAVTPGPPKEDIVTFDLSLRTPGSPGITATPYTTYLHQKPVSYGERIAMELNLALQTGTLDKILT